VSSVGLVDVPLFVGMAAFVVMEPATYAAHRWVMHGVGWTLHRSHHGLGRKDGEGKGRWEANDWFPVMFAALTVVAMAAGTTDRALGVLVPVGVGVTAYGAAYAFVHDVYIHGRFARLPVFGPLERLRRAHALHHRYGGEPYGMLCPIVPRALAERAAARTLGASISGRARASVPAAGDPAALEVGAPLV
jgi:beta-carotene 3-hydroxylase